MMGYLIMGEVQGELESITLDPESLVELVPLSSARNTTFEAMTFWNGNLYVIYEHNSMQNATQPVAYEFNQDLEFEREITFPVINFRVTDATSSDSSGKFWIMNYYFPGDTFLAVDEDPWFWNMVKGKRTQKMSLLKGWWSFRLKTVQSRSSINLQSTSNCSRTTLQGTGKALPCWRKWALY